VGERVADRLRAFARPWELASFVWIPAIILGYTVWYELHTRRALEDFSIFRTAGKTVLHGGSPFVAADPHALANFDKFVYPPSTALLFAPFAALPLAVSQVSMFVLSLLCTFVALRLLDVRDWRCYGVAVMWTPVINSLALGAVTSFLLVGTAAAWRYRDRPPVAGPVAALTAVLKVFLWPLGLWLVVTRRLRATATCVVVAAAVVFLGWAVIGFADLRSYPHLLHVLTKVEQGASYSPVALLRLTGMAATLLSVALVISVALGVGLAAHGADGDRRAFMVAIAGSLASTPVLWLHYFALLLVPIALYRPRLSGLWLWPLVLWLTPASHANGSTWRIGLALAVLTLVVARTVGEQQTQALFSWPSRITLLSRRSWQSLVGTD
jgi:alpha-1,2-mannosyltransferase